MQLSHTLDSAISQVTHATDRAAAFSEQADLLALLRDGVRATQRDRKADAALVDAATGMRAARIDDVKAIARDLDCAIDWSMVFAMTTAITDAVDRLTDATNVDPLLRLQASIVFYGLQAWSEIAVDPTYDMSVDAEDALTAFETSGLLVPVDAVSAYKADSDAWIKDGIDANDVVVPDVDVDRMRVDGLRKAAAFEGRSSSDRVHHLLDKLGVTDLGSAPARNSLAPAMTTIEARLGIRHDGSIPLMGARINAAEALVDA